MSNYLEIANRNSEAYLAALSENQERYLKYVGAWSRWLPSGGPASMQAMPLAELSGAMFRFYEKLLSQQQAYVSRLMAVMEPATGESATASAAAASPAKPAPVQRAKTATGRKATSSKKSSTAKAMAKKANAKKMSGKKPSVVKTS